MRQSIVSMLFVVLSSGCGERVPPPDTKGALAPMPAAASHAAVATSAGMPVAATVSPPASADIAAAFVDKVWRVVEESGVEAGTTYAFLHDGTLVIDAPHATPAKGQWRYAGGKLTMIEEGIAYPVDIVSLDATHFVIRSHNPGGSVEIAMVADVVAPLPHP